MLTRPADGWRPVLRAAPRGIIPWLTDHDSLTAAVRERCSEFRVHVVQQGLGRALLDEAPMIGVRPVTRVWVREVLLLADGVPWVWARSVASPVDLRTAWRDLAGLGNRSLGAALFADPRVGRGNLLSRRLDRRDPRGRAASIRFGPDGGAAALWARRSLFYRRRSRILVTEVFAPGIPARGVWSDAPSGTAPRRHPRL
jgi:chorismate--pyruvate lyase